VEANSKGNASIGDLWGTSVTPVNRVGIPRKGPVYHRVSSSLTGAQPERVALTDWRSDTAMSVKVHEHSTSAEAVPLVCGLCMQDA